MVVSLVTKKVDMSWALKKFVSSIFLKKVALGWVAKKVILGLLVLATIHTQNMDPKKYEELLEIGAAAYRKKYGYAEQRRIPGKKVKLDPKYNIHNSSVTYASRTKRVKKAQDYV